MGKVLDLNARLQQNKESKEREILLNFFKEMFGDQSKETLKAIHEAMLAGDEKRYKEITEPIIMRKTLKKFNQ